MFKGGKRVKIISSPYQGAKEFIGEEGTIISCNSKLAYGVRFDNGDYWFYHAEDFRLV